MRTLLLAVLLVLPTSLLAQESREQFLDRTRDQWLAKLKDKNETVRRTAAFALGRMGLGAKPAITELAKLLDDPQPAVRDAAGFALGEIAEAGGELAVWSEAGQKLISMIRSDADAGARRGALYALGCCGSTASRATGDIATQLRHEKPVVRQNAAWALGKIGQASNSVLNSLIEQVKKPGEDSTVKRDIAVALLNLKKNLSDEQAVAAAMALGEACNDRDPASYRACLTALWNIVNPRFAQGENDLKPVITAFRDALKNGDPLVKELVAGATAHLGQHAAPALPELLALAGDARATAAARRNAAVAVASIARQNSDALAQAEIMKAMAKLLKPGQPSQVREFIAESAVRVLQHGDDDLVQAVVDLCKEKPFLEIHGQELRTNYGARRSAVLGLIRLSPDRWTACKAPEVLTNILSEPASAGPTAAQRQKVLRYHAAQVLSMRLRAEVPPRTLNVLYEFLLDENIFEYRGTGTNVQGGSESQGGTSGASAQLGIDARFMAAQCLTRIGREGFKKVDAQLQRQILEQLRKLQNSKHKEVRDTVKEALEALQ